MRKMGIIAALLILGLVLAGCGGTSASSEATWGPEDSDSGSAVTATAEPAAPTATTAAEPVAASAGDADNGEQVYVQSCSSCHGPDATGVTGLGKDLTSNDFIQDMSDDELLVFIKQGRPSGDPANTTGIDMPPKGGNPAITDEQIMDIVAYLRTLQ